MGKRKRQRIDATDDWQQLHLLTTSAEQHLYELIRPIVLFGHSPAERARQTGAAERTLYRQSARFEADGMASLFATLAPGQRRTLPPAMRQAIRELHAEYPTFRQHGAPEALVSDSGGVFRATQALRIYESLGIRKEQIERRQSWQSYIETQFNVQRRMADWHFLQATSWLELLAAHDHWAVDFNYQVHWAHREREDGRHSPVEVLDWVHGRQVPPNKLHRIFYATRFGRKLNQAGYVRFRHWRLHGERGLAGEQAVVWLYREQLTVAFADGALAQYQVTYQPDDRHMAAVTATEVFETPYRSPQPPLWEWGADEWLAVVRVAPYAPRQPRPPAAGIQPRLFPDEAPAATG